MKKSVIIIIILILAVLAVNAYVLFFHMPYKRALEIVINAAGRDRAVVESFDKGFVIASAKAIVMGKDTFDFENKTYVTSTLRGQVQ